jgi:hypothetical protein
MRTPSNHARCSEVLPHGHSHRASAFVGLRRDELLQARILWAAVAEDGTF